MKKTYAGQGKPFITAMVQANTADNVISLIERAIPAGAEAVGIQTCRLPREEQNIDTYRRIFAAAGDAPTYVTHYRSRQNEGKTEDELAAGLLEIADAGATIVDVMGDMYAPHPDELTDDPRAVRKQKKLIKALHAKGAEVLMSSHTHKYMSAERILEIALAQQARGADVVKIVVSAGSRSEEAEVLRANALLKQVLRVPFLLLCGGSHHVLRRVTPYFGSCTWLTVLEYDECATKAQPLLADVVALRKVLEFQ